MSNCAMIDGSPPSASAMTAQVLRHQPEIRVTGLAGLTGQVVIAGRRHRWRLSARAICSSTGDGKTSDPKMAGTDSALIWSMISTNSRADGSAKSDSWMADDGHAVERRKIGP